MGARRQDLLMVSAFRLGLMGRCPRCGAGPLFSSYLALRKSCPVCGLNYAFADPADGPAFFAMTIWAFPALGFGSNSPSTRRSGSTSSRRAHSWFLAALLC